MANFAYYNITTSVATTVSAIDQPKPTSITVCNTDASGDDCKVDLFIDNSDSSSTIYILHDVVIPSGCTLILEQPEIDFDTTVYALKFKIFTVASSEQADVKITY